MATPGPRQYATALRSYAPNQTALGGYSPNYFSGQPAPTAVTSMAPHLSVATADRPFAADLQMVLGKTENQPDFEKLWRFSPHTYERRVAEFLRDPAVAGTLSELKNPPPPEDSIPSGFKRVIDEDGVARLVPLGENEGGGD